MPAMKPWPERRAGMTWDEIDDLINGHAFVGTDDSGTPYSYVHSTDAADLLWERLAPFSNFTEREER